MTTLQRLRLLIRDREKVKPNEIIGVGDGIRVRWVLELWPIKNDTDYVHAAMTLPSAGTTVFTTNIASLLTPRIVTVTGNAAGITGNVVVAGTDSDDSATNDTIVASGTSTVNGTQAFKTVTSITVPVRTTAGDAISVGINSTIITVNDTAKIPGTDYSLDFDTGLITFLSGKTPPDTHAIKAITYSYYAFSDVELEEILTIEGNILLLSAASCLRILAADSTRLFTWWSGDERVDMTKISANCLRAAKSFEDRYDREKSRARAVPASGSEYWEVEEENFGDQLDLDSTNYLDDSV